MRAVARLRKVVVDLICISFVRYNACSATARSLRKCEADFDDGTTCMFAILEPAIMSKRPVQNNVQMSQTEIIESATRGVLYITMSVWVASTCRWSQLGSTSVSRSSLASAWARRPVAPRPLAWSCTRGTLRTGRGCKRQNVYECQTLQSGERRESRQERGPAERQS